MNALRRLVVASLALFAVASQAQQVLRVTAIPDESPTELARKFAPLGAYLESKLGMKVEWTPVTDYAAAVETVVNKKIDLAWFGGFTFVQANVRSGGRIVPLVQREEDEKFRSVFITDAKSGINKLEDLKGKTLSFGSQSSTSGHLMPRSYLLAAYTILLGILACVGWLYIGQTDDAPGAGMIGFAALLSSLVFAYRVARSDPFKR